MRTALVIILLFLIGLFSGIFVYNLLNEASGAPSIIPSLKKSTVKDLAHYNEPFAWGATVRPFVLGPYDPAVWDEEIGIVKELGINFARVNWESDSTLERNDDILNRLFAQNINVVLVIEKGPMEKYTDDYQAGYYDGQTIATRYKGKIHFYQLMNEVSAQCVISNTSDGQKISDYDPTLYQKVTAYLRGLSEGISKADPDAWLIVPIGYTQTGFIDKIIQDNIQFDIIGLDWYDWAGNIATKKMDNGQLFSAKLKSYNKPVMFMEVNAVPESTEGSSEGTVVNEQKQSDFITQVATWAWQNQNFVKGFFVHELVDNVNYTGNNFQRFGIYSATKQPGKVGIFGSPRKAFTTYQNLIKKYSQ